MQFKKADAFALEAMFEIAKSNTRYYEYLNEPLDTLDDVKMILLSYPPNITEKDKNKVKIIPSRNSTLLTFW